MKQLCQGSSGAIYTSDNDIRRTATGTKSLMCLFFTLDCKFEKGMAGKCLFELPHMLITWCCVVRWHFYVHPICQSRAKRSCHVTTNEKIIPITKRKLRILQKKWNCDTFFTLLIMAMRVHNVCRTNWLICAHCHQWISNGSIDSFLLVLHLVVFSQFWYSMNDTG